MPNENTMNAAARIAKLDRLTAQHTAFRSFNEMTDRCRAGYVPTLRQTALVNALHREGFRTWG